MATSNLEQKLAQIAQADALYAMIAQLEQEAQKLEAEYQRWLASLPPDVCQAVMDMRARGLNIVVICQTADVILDREAMRYGVYVGAQDFADWPIQRRE